MKLMFHYIRRHIWIFIAGLLFLSVETFADLAQPALMSYVVDEGVKNQDFSQIFHYGLIMLAVTALGAVGAVMRNIFASHTSQTIGMELRGDMYRKVQTLSFENIDRLEPSSIITRITNDVTQIQNFINGIMRIMFKAPITCIGAIILIIIQTPRQFPVMAAILGISAILIAANMKLGYPRFGRLQERLDKLNDVSREFLTSIRVVKAFNAEATEEAKFIQAAGDFADAGVSAMRILAIFSPLINLTVNLGIIILLFLSQRQDAGQIGRLMASVNYMTQILFALGMVSNILNNAVRAMASSRRVQEILDEEPVQKPVRQPEAFKVSGDITFKNVTFAYAGTSRAAVEDLVFHVNSGEIIGIIGPTGSGKSTLVQLVPRFYDATSGQVLMDGRDVTCMDVDTLRNAVAVVPQKALLFSGTIAENLRWGDMEAADAQLISAAKIACAHDFIAGFPSSYETQLGQGGVNLSGGQKQRISIARALVKRPKVLILDDCTSALDADTEKNVLDGLNREIRGMTVLLISQRISTVMRADKILCMEDGRLCGFGTHDALMKSCRQYQEIYRSQIGGVDIG